MLFFNAEKHETDINNEMWQKYSKVELNHLIAAFFFQTNVQALLQNPDILKEIDNPHFSTGGVMRDIMDGNFTTLIQYSQQIRKHYSFLDIMMTWS